MKVNTYTEWQWDGEKYVEVANESYEYEGVVSEVKGGGGSSCPPPDTTPMYSYDPNLQQQSAGGIANTMGGIASLGNQGTGDMYANAGNLPVPPQANGANYGAANPMQGGPIGPSGPQYINPIDMMSTETQVNQPIMAYDPAAAGNSLRRS